MTYKTEPAYTHGSANPTGILLVNLGTPDEPTTGAVRRYLKQFLADERVVEIPKIIWWFILNLIILNTRPAKSAKQYQKIWTRDGSPLRYITERQTQKLRGFIGERINSTLKIECAMRYGNPSIVSAIDKLKNSGCDNILVMPLYPQYSASTTASTFDELARVFKQIRNVPGIRFVKSFHDHPAYIDAMVKNIQAEWTRIGRPDFSTDKLLMTFHGVPKFHLDRGDPYHCQCHKTGRLIAEALGLNKDEYLVTFQSRFGAAEWLQPYTDKTLAALATQGVKRVDVICPGFAADCLETLEEIAIEARAIFLNAGGEHFNYIAVANDSESYVHALTAIALDNLHGWVNTNMTPVDAEKAQGESASRARIMGATQ